MKFYYTATHVGAWVRFAARPTVRMKAEMVEVSGKIAGREVLVTPSRPSPFTAQPGGHAMTARDRLAEYFWARVHKTDSCWLWTKALDVGGYGFAYVNGRKHGQQAHRVSWEMHFGEIPSGLHVCHHCDVRNCVRPDHLFLGTDLTNARDRERKGRGVLVKGITNGERNLNAKLTAQIVLRLRLDAACWSGSQRDLHQAKAAEYGVSETCIREAIKGTRKWTNL